MSITLVDAVVAQGRGSLTRDQSAGWNPAHGAQLEEALVTVLAAARLTRLVSEDEITKPLRKRVGKLHSEVDYFVNCRYCVGVWAAAGVLLMQKHPVGRVACRVLAVAGAANLVQRGWD